MVQTSLSLFSSYTAAKHVLYSTAPWPVWVIKGQGIFLVWKSFLWLVNGRESEEMGASSYKEKLPTAKSDFKDGGTEGGGKHILTSAHDIVDGFWPG